MPDLLLRSGVIIISLITLTGVIIYNEAKPLVGDRTIWTLDRTDQISMNLRGMNPVIDMVDKVVPAGSRLGLLIGANETAYPFWGEHFERYLIPVFPHNLLTNSDWIDKNKIEFILISKLAQRTKPVPDNFSIIGNAEGWQLYLANDSSSLPKIKMYQDQWACIKTFSIILVEPALNCSVGILSISIPDWAIEPKQPDISIGSGVENGMELDLYSKKTINAELIINAALDPSQQEPGRTIIITKQKDHYSDEEATMVFGSTLIKKTISLDTGINNIYIYVLPQSEITPTGDAGSLLLKINNVTITQNN